MVKRTTKLISSIIAFAVISTSACIYASAGDEYTGEEPSYDVGGGIVDSGGGIETETIIEPESSSETWEDNAKALTFGKTIKTNMAEDGMQSDFKFVVPSRGTVTVVFISRSAATTYDAFTTDGEYIDDVKNVFVERTINAGGYDFEWAHKNSFTWNSGSQKSKVTFIYKNLPKGTYYIRIRNRNPRRTDDGTQLQLATFFKSDTKSIKKSVSTQTTSDITLSIPLKKGTSTQFGSGVKDDVFWSSSNVDVATVSSSGKVTAKSSGSAVITANANGAESKVKVNVS